jgi:hypothetical protein
MDKNEFLIALSEGEHTQFGRVAFVDQPEQQKVFSAIWGLESQVNNGGFTQYFVSHDGEAAEFAPRALRTIGAKACADLVERALRTVSASPLPTSQSARESVVDSVSTDVRDRLEELDQEFFAYPDDLTDLLFTYVADHPEVFGPVPVDGDA